MVNKEVKTKITSVKSEVLSVPLRVSHKTALRSVKSVEDIIVEIHNDTGYVKYREDHQQGQ